MSGGHEHKFGTKTRSEDELIVWENMMKQTVLNHKDKCFSNSLLTRGKRDIGGESDGDEGENI